MRLIDRYLLREFLFWLAVFFAGFLMIWIAFDLGLDPHRFQQANMRGKDVAEYYFYEIPEFIPIALPVAILLATLYVITNHARYNEITAIRAAGISLVRLCMPYFAAGLFFSALLFAFNEYFAPHAGDMADEIMIRRVDPTAKAQHYLTPSFVFVSYGKGGKVHKWTATVYNSKTHEMTTPLITWPSTNGLDISISATTAKWTNNVWVLTGNVVKTMGATTRLLVTNYLALPEVTETPAEFQSDIKVNKYHSITRKTRRADIPLADIVNYLRFHPQPDRKMRSWLFTKLYGRFAGPFACLVVVIVAIPFSARSGRRNIFVGVAASIFIFFTYFVLQQVGLTFGETGWMPSWLGAWFPNLFFGLGGLFLMSRVR
jgi:lipopolysaccharide export system permease protein